MKRGHILPAILAALILLLACIPVLTACGAETSAGSAAQQETLAGTDLTVRCFSAGAADAFLLYTQNSAVLIDCGEKGFGKEILSFLEENGIESLDYLIITHFDQDHVGGAAKVINSFSVGTVLQSNCPKDSEEYEKYIKALDSAGLQPVTVTDTLTFTLDGVRYTVDGPDSGSYEEDESNNSSLIVLVENGENSLLFMGDAQTLRLEEFLDSHPAACDFLKVPHHGREEPLTEQLLEAVSPRYAVITSSQEELESQDTLTLLEKTGAEVFLTRLGAVTVHSDGKEITVEYE